MTAILNPYLNFRGEARAAMDFYRTVFGGELTRMTFAEGGMPIDEAEQDNVMHSQLDVDGLTLMAADVPGSMPGDYGNGSVSLSGTDDAKLRGYWERLSDGADISAPLNQAPWGDAFGMLTDRFGVRWLVNITGAQS